jgi:hypothetical protein
MLTPTERQYYTYITQFFGGRGEVVELGCWLGLSTMYLVRGLLDNPRFTNRKLYVFDDFVWRAWMSAWLEGVAAHEAPVDHGSFESMFAQNISPVRDRVEAARRKISDYDGNEGLPPLTWNRGPVEMLVVDCGRMLRVNEAWWEIFQPHFIPDRTLVIMQDWQHYKNVPEQHWENTKIFTDSKGSALDLAHEARHSGVATFLYRGQRLPHGSP